MKYTGKLFGKVGKTYIPLILTSDEVDAMERDKSRIDWLADPENAIGNVQLPVGAVTENIGSLRDAIDAAMSGNYEKNAPMVEPGYFENVQELATPLARAHSETGVEVHITGDVFDRAASGGCPASTC